MTRLSRAGMLEYCETELTGILQAICHNHPLLEIEAQYLAELILEYHGESMIDRKPEAAGMMYNAVIDFLACTRLAPIEVKYLKRQLTEPLPA